MRLVHLADLHLGFRQYHRLTPKGLNQREADIAGAFQRAIDRVIALKPDVVLFAGDVFHSVRPNNSSIIHAFSQLSRLRIEAPESIVVMVSGNHDGPRSTETGCILRLFSQLGIHVADVEPRRLLFPEKNLSILAVPHAIGALPALTPSVEARFNVLLLHGEVEGVLPSYMTRMDRASPVITHEDLGSSRWSYVALGHYHVYHSWKVAPNTYYSGALEYTTPNVWGEIQEEREAGISGKGFIEYDLETARHRFHALEPSRKMLDLAPIHARGLSAPEVDAEIRSRIEGCDGGIDDRIIRLVIRDVPRHI
ncbi:MAG: exonuclease SbcCD subunit D, partial [Gemmatimonadaceae bacterium]